MNRNIIIGNKSFELGKRTYIMGILNVTPDSFSDGGSYQSVESAVLRADEMMHQGTHIIDVGGESTRPGHTPVDEDEEIRRVVPVIKELTKRFDIPVSIDTYKAKVAEAAIQNGAAMINDVWGFKRDPLIAKVAAEYGVACCLMHNREKAVYNNIISDMLDDLKESIDIALNAGVRSENIIIDPGIGFAKTYEENLHVMTQFEKFTSLGYPLLLGTSRKSMIGNTLHLPTDQRVEGTIATTVVGIMKGCDFVRVHDIEQIRRAIVMTDAIVRR